MSYAEHGPRIFLASKPNLNPVTKYGDSVVARKRSEGRLKSFDSCTDLRAWSSNVIDNFRYFREVVANPLPRGSIEPYDVISSSLAVLGERTREVASLRRQLERYKSLRLTPEQEKQLRDGDSSEDPVSPKDSASLQQFNCIEDESPIPKRPETPVQSASSSSTSFHEGEAAGRGGSDESSSEDRSSEDVDVPEMRSRRDRSRKNYRAAETDDHQTLIIEKDSTIIALKNELAAKESELEEFRELSQKLESTLHEKEALIDHLRENLRISQEHVQAINNQFHQRMEEWKQKMHNSKCLIDRLNAALVEKSQECAEHIETMEDRIKETELLREEKDSLVRKLDEAKSAIRERNDLAKLNRQQALNIADQEKEIKSLMDLITRNAAKHDKREIEMECAIENLRAQIEAKNEQLSEFEAHCVAIRREIGDSTSFTEMQTGAIRKCKRHLQDDLDKVEKELARRSGRRQDDDWFRHEETVSRPNETIDRSIGTMAHRDDWEREKEFMECTIEKLTIQVSESNATKEEQADIHELIVSQFCTIFEKMQRLVVELEAYGDERPSLIKTIDRLNGALKEARDTIDSRESTTQKQYLAELSDKHKNQCDAYEKRIASLTSKVAKLRNERENMIDKFRREMDQRPDGTMDERIDDVLFTRTKRSIETIEKLSAALRGAGDYHDDEMAKKDNELDARNAEIAKLREQVAFSVSRGQGDQPERDHSYEFRFKALEREVKETKYKYKKRDQEANDAVKEIGRLEKEISCLNRTVQRAGELQTQVDEMQLRLESLQAENAKLTDEVLKANEICAEYKNTVIDLVNREARATDARDRAECKLQTMVSKWSSDVEDFKRENDKANEELEEKKLKIAQLSEQIQCLKENSRKLEILDKLLSEITNVDKRINQLHTEVSTLRSRLDDHHRSNTDLERDLDSKLEENERLQSDIRVLHENIERFSRNTLIPEAADKLLLLNSLPHKICNRLENLRLRFNISDTEDRLFRNEIEQWRAKSRDDTLLIENLRNEIKLYNDKAVQQDAIIVALQEANADLKTKLEEIHSAVIIPASENSPAATSKLVSRLENELRDKEEEINKLNSILRIMIAEKNDFSNQRKKDEDLHQAKLAELQQNYSIQMRQFRAEHNASIKRLEKQYEESFGKPFNAETWLLSLSPKQKAELHKRLCMAGPCETVNEVSRNDKLNKQQDEKLHDIHLRNGHNKEPEIVSPYVYERRKFDTARYGPLETSFTDTDDMKKVDFVLHCAYQHKHDGSH